MLRTLFTLLIIVLIPPQEYATYSPLTDGNSWIYKMSDGSFETYIDSQKYTHKNIEYFQSITKYSDGTAEISYYRAEKNGAIYYLDDKTFQESIEIPANPRLSYQWNSSDYKWKYKIVEVNATLKTPTHTFKDCIAIKAVSTAHNGGVYINYYSKGVGFVGSKIENELVTYLIRWKLNEKRM